MPQNPDAPSPSHAERARTLAANAVEGALATIATEPEGYPFASRVLFAVHEGDPVFLISELATHTKHLRASPRSSLLISEAGADDPLALGRVTVLGTTAPVDDAAVRETFLDRHADARRYADLGDFSFWRMQPTAIRYIGGFGRMSWIDPSDWYAAEPDPLAAAEAGIVAHMNDDHADTLPLYCRAFGGLVDASDARMTRVDRYGFEIAAVTAEGPRTVRIPFSRPVTEPTGVRRELIALLREARTTGP